MLAIAALACDLASLVPSGATYPTTVPGEVETVIAGTAGAAQTQTAELLSPTATPSLTPTATHTPSPTPSLTPTFIFFLRSPVPTRTNTPEGGGGTVLGSGDYACRLVSQDPKDNTVLKPNAKFNMVWQLQNAGTATWVVDDVDFEYVSGRKMQEQDVYDLPLDVAPGETVNMSVAMNAPKVAGDWKTVWTLRAGDDDFCHVNVTIVVE